MLIPPDICIIYCFYYAIYTYVCKEKHGSNTDFIRDLGNKLKTYV